MSVSLSRTALALLVVGASLASASSGSTTAVLRSTWQEEANITNINTECTAYDYPPVDDVIKNYPTVWDTASLTFSGVLAADKAVFTAINSSIPNIAPRGTINGDFSGVKYDSSDPDCWWTYSICTTPKLAGLEPDISNCPEPNTWGFTLDDGPNCSHNAYYDYLQTIEQKATLFYIGSNVMDLPLEAQRGLADGHEICAHTWSHPYMTSLTNEEAFAELYYSKKAIKDVMGITVTCWRPPYGDVDDRIRWIAKQLGMTTVLWKHDTFDGSYPTETQAEIYANYQSIIDQGANGTYNDQGIIVLTHEIMLETMEFSEHFLPQIQKTFTGGVMPVGVCQNWTNIYGEGSGYEYPNYAQWAAGTRTISVPVPTAATSNVAFATASIVISSGLPAGPATTTGASSAVKTGSSTKSGASATKAAASNAVSASTTAAPSSGGTSNSLAGSLLAGALGLAGFAAAMV